MNSQQSTNAFVKETFMDLKTQLETVAKNHQALIQNLETKFDRLADKQSGRSFGSLPSNTQPNPRGSKAYQPPQARNEHKQLNLGVGTERMIFNIDSAMKHSYSNDDTCFSIDVIDEILEEDFDALLDEGSKILHSIEGTLLKEEIFAEFDEFMEMTADENSDSESDTEEPPFDKITINTDYKIKTSLEEPPTDLELKPPSFLPVIISSQLSKEKKNKLVSILKKHKEAFAWITIDIPGICPSFCKHKIQLLDDKKLVVQKQRRLNPNMQEVIKKEIMKLLDTSIIYPVADSPWGSPIHCVPKKGGITVVTNENDELVPTRTVSGWRDMIEEFVKVFMDDFSVFGNSFDKCLNNLDRMLQRCKDAHLVLNWEKSYFMVKKIIVLGHKVFGAGLKVNRAKINIISKLLPPTNIKGVRSFLGHASFYRRFIKDFSKIARPITKLLEKDTPFEFNDECQKAFDLLKEKLTCALVIANTFRAAFGLYPYHFTYPERKLTIEEMLYKFIEEGKREHQEMRAFICDFQTTNEILFKEQNNSVNRAQIWGTRVVKGVTTRGGKTTTQDAQNNDTSIHTEEPQEEKEEAQQKKFLVNLKHLHINLPFIEALAQMPKYAKFLKGLLTNKARLEEACTITMNERCSVVLLNKLPSKEKDPGSFTSPCDIGQLHINNALANLGDSISLMPYTMYEKLVLGEPKATRMSLELAGRSIQYPRGIIENVLIKVDKFILLINFVILDMPEDSRVPIILGRPFLATARAMIDVFNKKIMLRVGDDEVIFDVDQSINRPPTEDNECYGIDDLDNTINAEAQELLANDESDSFLLRGLEKSIDQSDLESCEPVECNTANDSNGR
ncbi:reverse transcriptase domain-containing protein [Tanacetum coccineum]